MFIEINDKDTLDYIQQRFSSAFPYLRLEFIRKKLPFSTPGASVKHPITLLDKTLAESRTTTKEGTITISPAMTISQLEKSFTEIYGISTQVLRQSGNIWLVTTVTDKWTLEEQNMQGEIITQQVNDRKFKQSE